MPGRRRIHVRGIVQGVGFRPFIYRLARESGLKGMVRNTTTGVEIEIEGPLPSTERFIAAIRGQAPPAARIDGITADSLPYRGYADFSIRESKRSRGFTQISPDIATCRDCLREMEDPADRRYEFPFINCTNCGPRYSIIKGTPYDRQRTSMREFRMCQNCRREFDDVADRRFHAQPDCCPACGPTYRLYSITGREIAAREPIKETAALLKKGRIVAIKGIGGFHIACDAQNCETVAQLRRLKDRPSKPLAVMVRPGLVPGLVHATKAEMKTLTSPSAPIVLMKKKGDRLCAQIAPGNPYLGVMIPYSPAHHLLLRQIPYLVMTSANVQDEPIVDNAQEVRQRLGSLVSFYLDHDRSIENRCDDSVGFSLPGRGFSIIRRSRGYAPLPVELPVLVSPTLAVGPYLKNTFTLATGRAAYVSPHIGDLDNLETMRFYGDMVEKYRRWFRIEPRIIAHDLHPDYLSTKIARSMDGVKKGVQHHAAHFTSCLGENGITGNAIGIIFDGTGFGTDGRIWGGEFFTGNLQEQTRVAHLQYLPLPGGESSIRKPYRIAIAYAYALLRKRLAPAGDDETEIIRQMIDTGHNIVHTSSMGRLFDCISALLGITTEITYEAEAAINLEHVADQKTKGHFPFVVRDGRPMTIEVEDTLRAIVGAINKNVPKAKIAARFHNTIAEFSCNVANRLRKMHGLTTVCLSGGVFQNRYLLTLMIERLEKDGFRVHTHRQLPTNDGCISYGQVLAANAETEDKMTLQRPCTNTN
ncbi:carbamoyltransferase HypF [candidate division WOR-3 bacterium]|nr:carbamoyltransferase HypF [candidate division WOR-3 bacterium]